MKKVQTALANDSRTQDAAIEILNENGVIRLSGIVSHNKISETAESIVRDIDGVVSVINEIQVKKDFGYNNPFDVSGTLDEDVIVK